jgi:hypothetical protein
MISATPPGVKRKRFADEKPGTGFSAGKKIVRSVRPSGLLVSSSALRDCLASLRDAHFVQNDSLGTSHANNQLRALAKISSTSSSTGKRPVSAFEKITFPLTTTSN